MEAKHTLEIRRVRSANIMSTGIKACVYVTFVIV